MSDKTASCAYCGGSPFVEDALRADLEALLPAAKVGLLAVTSGAMNWTADQVDAACAVVARLERERAARGTT